MSKNCEIVKVGFFKCDIIPVCPKCGHKEPKESVQNFTPAGENYPVYTMQCSNCGYFYQYRYH